MTCPIYLSGEPRADESLVDAAMANVKRWRFVPVMGNSKMFRQTTVDLRFELSETQK